MFILKKGHQPGVYVPLRALFLVFSDFIWDYRKLPFNIWEHLCSTLQYFRIKIGYW